MKTSKMKLTIDKTHYRIIARDKDGNIHAEASTNCNPAALRQVVLRAEMIGAIDWRNSMCAKPSRRK